MPGLVPGTLSSATHSLTKYFVKLNIVKKYKKYNITKNKLSQKYNMYGLVPGTLSSSTHSAQLGITKYFVKSHIVKKYKKYNITQNFP